MATASTVYALMNPCIGADGRGTVDGADKTDADGVFGDADLD